MADARRIARDPNRSLPMIVASARLRRCTPYAFPFLSLPLSLSLSLSLFVANTGERHSSTADQCRSRGTSREGSRLSILPGKLGRAAETASATTHATSSASASTSADRLPPQFASNGCPRIPLRPESSSPIWTRELSWNSRVRTGRSSGSPKLPESRTKVEPRARRNGDTNRDGARSAHPLDVSAIFSRRSDTCL